MKTINTIFLTILFLFNVTIYAQSLSTGELAKIHDEGIKLFKKETNLFAKLKNNVLSNNTLSPKQKEVEIFLLRENFMSQSRRIHAEYRQPFIDAVLLEVNNDMPKGGKISQSLGSDIYLKDSTGSYKMNKEGNRILNPSHRGMMGDLDLGGNPKGIQQLDSTLNKYGISQTTDNIITPYNHVAQKPGYADFKDIEITVNNEGDQLYTNKVNSDGSVRKSNIKASLHEQQMYKAKLSPDGTIISSKEKIILDAFSKETYVSVSMAEKQAGKKFVETQDHIKKARKGLNVSPKELLSSKGEDLFQGMNKGTLKSIHSAEVTNKQLSTIIKKQKLTMSVDEFKRKLTLSKEGHIAEGIGILDEKTMKKYQATCAEITKTAHVNASTVASIELAQVDAKIDELNELIIKTPQGSEKTAYQRQAKMWKEQQSDSKLKMQTTSESSGMVIKKEPTKKLQKALVHGQKGLSAIGNLSDALEIYDTYSNIQTGKISQNEGAATMAAKAVDIGTNIAIDTATTFVSTTGATTTMGSIATVAAPILVTAVAVHYVSKATKEGLDMASSFKNEEILSKISDAKMQETANHLMQEAEKHLKKGIKSGDMDHFIDAEELSWKLTELYLQTGDTGLLDAANTIDNRSETVQKILENKHGVSMFELKAKLQTQKEQSKEKNIVFDTQEKDPSLDSEMAFVKKIQRDKDRQERADNITVNSNLYAHNQREAKARAQFQSGMQELQGAIVATGQAIRADNIRTDQQIKENNYQYRNVVNETIQKNNAYRNKANYTPPLESKKSSPIQKTVKKKTSKNKDCKEQDLRLIWRSKSDYKHKGTYEFYDVNDFSICAKQTSYQKESTSICGVTGYTREKVRVANFKAVSRKTNVIIKITNKYGNEITRCKP